MENELKDGLDTEAAEKAAEDIDAAFDKEFKGIEKVEKGESGEVDEDGLPKDNRKRSDLGRKIKELTENAEKDRELMKQILERLSEQSLAKKKEVVVDEDDEEMPETIVTPEDLEKYARIKKKREERALENYQSKYRQLLGEYKSKDDNFDEILAEITSNPEFDKIHTWKPEVDVELNYAKAARAVMAKKLAAIGGKKEVPVKGEKESATGLSGASRTESKEVVLPKLSADVLEYAKSLNMSNEEIADALAGR